MLRVTRIAVEAVMRELTKVSAIATLAALAFEAR
jgi:hypothetical protein